MNMTHVTPSYESEREGRQRFSLEDTDGVGERFKTGFANLLAETKRTAVVDLLKAEMPHLATNDNFIDAVFCRLSDTALIAEKRFVFLALNPNYRPE